MNERLRLIREDTGLSQSAFGQRICVSRDVINNLERGRVEAKDHIIKLICAEYSVNEEWLRFGTGSMYIKPPAFSLDTFVKENQVDDLESDIIRAYFEIAPEVRKEALEQFKAAMGMNKRSPWDAPDTPEELEKLYPPMDIGNSGSDVG